jgi:hypothetical protein
VNPIDLYSHFIRWIGDGTGAPDTVLHIHAGMAVLLAARVVTGRSLATPWPLLAVFVAELTNEVLDYFIHGRVMPDTLSDVLNTVFWPTVLFIGLRIRRARQDRPPYTPIRR